MRNTLIFKGKLVTVIGLARSGLACANLLFSLGAKVRVSEAKDNPQIRLNVSKLKSKKIKFELGSHTRDFIRGADLVVVSPGVTQQSRPVAWARAFDISVVSEIEIGWLLCSGKIIAVTGSSGKTTVTTLIANVLEADKKRVFTCGNIGRPFTSLVHKIREGDYVSLEVSSFQLEGINHFKPEVAVMLNISPNHLDRHKDMQEYVQAKKRIFINQDKGCFAVLNANDLVVKNLASRINAQTLFFKESRAFNPNQAAVLCVASLLGIRKNVCLKVFKEFKGIQHRFERLESCRGVSFINDSKSTTGISTIWALKNLFSPVILIAGGRDKGIDYKAILPYARNKVKEVFAVGEAKNKIKQALSDCLPFYEAASLSEAVKRAFDQARRGDCILLSPMCSSFDMFSDYQARGRAFKRIVADLIRKNKKNA
ncbi:MAG: UDP-N-acetylmuramoyl-L-alanine--D-glutamate ligase [Candidatus Omnitrophota bacterium]|nr:UDP-N-acetylmuramoyl-L-alanine--D-glutamate ligase [Candidatus Omnitrophota bacterium]